MKEVSLKSTLENVEVLTGIIDSELESVGCPTKAIMQVDVAIDEIFSNIVNYGYDCENEEIVIKYDVDPKDKSISITFVDSGKRYNPLDKDDPNISEDAETRKIGGLGIYIVKKTMDNMVYKYENSKNYLTIIKKF